MRTRLLLTCIAAAGTLAAALPAAGPLPAVTPAPAPGSDAAPVTSSTSAPRPSTVPQDPEPFDPDSAQRREEYFEVGDLLGTVLHADVLRDGDASWTARQPVVLVVSPYTNHSGATTDYDPTTGGAVSDRFFDFLALTDALGNGYTFVQADLPGNGGSSGCNDWGGAREQGAVAAAVRWAATQPWSSGDVALLGKSYDGWTGLMGMAQDPHGEFLDAVVSMEPVFSGYRYLWDDGVRFTNSVLTNVLFQAIDAKPGSVDDDPRYNVNGAPQAWCYGVNVALQQQDSEDTAFWAERDLVRRAAGSTVPLFLTQGFLETNTKPDAAFAYFDVMDNPRNRAWFGQYDHVRGWDRRDSDPLGDGRLETGREGFAAEVLAFLDEHLRGVAPRPDLPAVVVQDNLGRHRAEQAWPPADATDHVTSLRSGSFVDGVGTTYSTDGIFTVSQVLDRAVHLAGEPRAAVTVAPTLPRTNLVVNVLDVAPDGTATHVSRGTVLVRDAGEQVVDVELYGQDWVFARGHRIAVRVVGANTDWWQLTVGTRSEVPVLDAEIALPLLPRQRTAGILDGGSTPRLEEHLARTVDLDGADTGEPATFDLP